MRFVILPVEDAEVVVPQDVMAHVRKSVDGTKVLMHENLLLQYRETMGFPTLEDPDTGEIQWTYPVYNYGDDVFADLLGGPEWTEIDNS